MQYRATAYENILKIQSYLHHMRSVLNVPLDWIFCFPKTVSHSRRRRQKSREKSERVAVTVNKTVDLPNDL